MTSEIDPATENGKAIRLGDGRMLGYAEYGVLDGPALFYFHGHPGSRYEAGFVAGPAAQAGVRLIGVDRPGMGLSSYKSGRQLLDWPDDVVELADHLHLERFAVAGFSGGGPYALACAKKISGRLTACGIIAGVGDPGWFLSSLAQWAPWLLLRLSRGMFRNWQQAIESLKRVSGYWNGPDRKALAVPGVLETMAASLVEALRPGAGGAAYDGVLAGSRNLGFCLEEITFPKIYLWHGELDKEIPVSAARAAARKLAHSKATFFPSEGHISLIVNHRKEIITELFS